MKKLSILTILVFSLLVGCSNGGSNTDTTQNDTTAKKEVQEVVAEEPAETEESTQDTKEDTKEEDSTQVEKGEKPKGERFTPTKTVDELPTLEQDGLTVHYSEGYEEKAQTQMKRLVAMQKYIKEQTGLEITTIVNVLDEEDKNAIVGTNIAYGMPFVIPASADNENEIFLPATEEGCIIDATLKYKDVLLDETLNLFTEAGYDAEKAIRIYPDLIGLHEVGHACAFEGFGDKIKDYPRWFNEFMATYYSYSYMMANEPELAKVWIGNAYISYLDGTKPEYTAFADFEKNAPMNMTEANYDWYQKQMNLIVAKLYDEMGLEFHNKAVNLLTADSYDTDEIIEKLGTITNVFEEWIKTVDNY